jgi:hypothetical protein
MQEEFIINNRLKVEPNFSHSWDNQDIEDSFIFIDEYKGDTFISLNLKEAEELIVVLQEIVNHYKK